MLSLFFFTIKEAFWNQIPFFPLVGVTEERRHLGVSTVEVPNIGILFPDLDDVKMDWDWAGRGRARPMRHPDG
jgi:hypothetical protein